MTIPAVVFAGTFGLALVMECLSYVLGARRTSVKNIDKKVKETSEILLKEKSKTKPDEKMIDNLSKQLNEKQKELSQALIWAQLAPTVLSLMLMPPILRKLSGQVAGYLPFNIAWPFTMILQSGLTEPDSGAVSMTFLYFVSIALCRSVARRFFPQITPPSPF